LVETALMNAGRLRPLTDVPAPVVYASAKRVDASSVPSERTSTMVLLAVGEYGVRSGAS